MGELSLSEALLAQGPRYMTRIELHLQMADQRWFKFIEDDQ